jgi:hypothetical protein
LYNEKRSHALFSFFVFSTDVVFTSSDFYPRIAPERRLYSMDENEFKSGSVPVSIVARVYGKDASWVRAGIISGWLPIGIATRNGKLVTSLADMKSRLGRINFYISPKLLWEETGYLWRGEKNDGHRRNTSGII